MPKLQYTSTVIRLKNRKRASGKLVKAIQLEQSWNNSLQSEYVVIAGKKFKGYASHVALSKFLALPLAA